MYIAPGQGQTGPREQNFDTNRKALPLPICASFKEISLSLMLYNFFHDLIHVYSTGAGHTAPRGQSFDVNRNFLSLRSSVACFNSWMIGSEKSIVLSFSPYKSIRNQI